MGQLIVSVPTGDAGRKAIHHLQEFGGRTFGCRYKESLSDRLGKGNLRSPSRLRDMPQTFHLIETENGEEAVVMNQILRFHDQDTSPERNRGFVTSVEPNGMLKLSMALSLPFMFSPMHTTYLANLNISSAHTASPKVDGAGIKVAVVDSGASGLTVTDFYDVLDPVNQHPGSSALVDKNGHGTVMTQIIQEVAPGSSVYVIRITDKNRVSLWDVLAGISLAIFDCAADIVNLSLGLPGFGISPCHWCGGQPISKSIAFKIFIDQILNADTMRPVLVAATGNGRSTTSFEYPAAYDSPLAVGAVTSRKIRSSFSNFGTTKTHYLMAPGGEETGGTVTEAVGHDAKRRDFAGTSAAAAYTSGVLSLLWSGPYASQDRKTFLGNIAMHCSLPTGCSSTEYGLGLIRY